MNTNPIGYDYPEYLYQLEPSVCCVCTGGDHCYSGIALHGTCYVAPLYADSVAPYQCQRYVDHNGDYSFSVCDSVVY